MRRIRNFHTQSSQRLAPITISNDHIALWNRFLTTVSSGWAEARIKITRMILTIKLDRNWSSFQLANSAPPLSVTGSAIAPSARMRRFEPEKYQNIISWTCCGYRSHQSPSSTPLNIATWKGRPVSSQSLNIATWKGRPVGSSWKKGSREVGHHCPQKLGKSHCSLVTR